MKDSRKLDEVKTDRNGEWTDLNLQVNSTKLLGVLTDYGEGRKRGKGDFLGSDLENWKNECCSVENSGRRADWGGSQELGSEWLFRVSPEHTSKDSVHWRYHPVDERAGL